MWRCFIAESSAPLTGECNAIKFRTESKSDVKIPVKKMRKKTYRYHEYWYKIISTLCVGVCVMIAGTCVSSILTSLKCFEY